MAFPASPTAGDSYTEHGETWTFDGQVWNSGGLQVQSDGRIIFLDNAVPTEAPENSVWYRHDTSAIATKTGGAWDNIPESVSVGVSTPAPEEEPAGTAQFTITFPNGGANIDEGSALFEIAIVPNENVVDGVYDYTISGITQDDLSSGDLIGQFLINNNGATQVEVEMAADQLTEGDETLTFTIDATGDNASVVINDTSTEPAAGALFVATPSNEGTTEGRSWTVTLTPSAGATGTTATWNWTGIQSADLDPSSSFGTDISGVWTFLDDTTPMNFTFKFIQDDGNENETGYFNIAETGDSFSVYIRDRQSF